MSARVLPFLPAATHQREANRRWDAEIAAEEADRDAIAMAAAITDELHWQRALFEEGDDEDDAG